VASQILDVGITFFDEYLLCNSCVSSALAVHHYLAGSVCWQFAKLPFQHGNKVKSGVWPVCSVMRQAASFC